VAENSGCRETKILESTQELASPKYQPIKMVQFRPGTSNLYFLESLYLIATCSSLHRQRECKPAAFAILAFEVDPSIEKVG